MSDTQGMAGPRPSPHAWRVSDLPRQQEREFDLKPGPEELLSLAERLELRGLKKVAFIGRLQAYGSADWRLEGRLGATVIQPCVATLEPVTTRLDVPVVRLFTPDYVEPDAPEAEMPEDDTIEPLGRWIDLFAVLEEALALALPLYPRKEAAEVGQFTYTEPGQTPMSDADAKPFAQLVNLRAGLSEKADGADED